MDVKNVIESLEKIIPQLEAIENQLKNIECINDIETKTKETLLSVFNIVEVDVIVALDIFSEVNDAQTTDELQLIISATESEEEQPVFN